MTTALYDDGTHENVLTSAESSVLQKKWLITEIIKPELPNLIDHVEKCLELLSSEERFVMPLSNGSNIPNGTNSNISSPSSASNSNSSSTTNTTNSSTSIKGTITRQSGYIVDFHAVVKLPDFNKGRPIMLKMETGKKYPLVQIQSIISNLARSLNLFDELQQISESKTLEFDETQLFEKKIGKILELLTQSITLLQNPPRELIFPHNNNNFLKNNFGESYEACESTHHLVNMELVLFKNEVCLDIRNLTKVVKRPWCEVDPNTGLSFADKVRDRLKQDRNGRILEILKEHGLQVDDASVLNNLLSSFSVTERITLPQANNLLARCVTFDGRVVTECEKVSINTSDPTLISVSAKLTGLENKISNQYVNIQNLNY
ncbi:regulator of V-ATPase in vacuolar membrane protein 2 [Kluyveromyces marxianus]|uniref:Regulator of V-ATPase in vacuolar membrane protein 2 n=2 Tax=Kluyveromyces marxianus TaxID=4911 RepID=W0TDT9_KLUMD|nr:regulator of V-ATPase in vacuolar membrane protein 2 [Kluyveromyces marxianus DMKU3-1042]QGN16944.1 regulator of V-ATPase in vacuolar membrane protein 2 [Kluyveromyces marxianus]BAO41238.1 regulator of V-ATPase in vacuolar membrane protein 2 [Kluyveromyces marxianus DMKU3-1042]